MEEIMKTWSLILAGMLLMAVGTSTGQTTVERSQQIKVEKAEKNYLHCLNSATDAIVESALGGIVSLKLAFPEHEFAALEHRVEGLAVHGRTAAIRFKAYLTNAVLENPAQFGRFADLKPERNEELFYSIATELQISLLGYSGE